MLALCSLFSCEDLFVAGLGCSCEGWADGERLSGSREHSRGGARPSASGRFQRRGGRRRGRRRAAARAVQRPPSGGPSRGRRRIHGQVTSVADAEAETAPEGEDHPEKEKGIQKRQHFF